jgi:hypothetical protein
MHLARQPIATNYRVISASEPPARARLSRILPARRSATDGQKFSELASFRRGLRVHHDMRARRKPMRKHGERCDPGGAIDAVRAFARFLRREAVEHTWRRRFVFETKAGL